MLRTRFIVQLLLALVVLMLPAQAWAWSHQGHILMTRLACLRILQDPAAPEGLKTFISGHMKYDLEACRKLAEDEVAGAEPKNYLTGFEGVATLPDRAQGMSDGKVPLAPFKMPEDKMHFLDLEVFCADPVYLVDPAPQQPQVPTLAQVARDFTDPRYKIGGYVMFRVPQCYGNLVTAIKAKKDAETLNWAGYLMHYLEDSHQPHHSTIDFKSLSYLAAAKVPGVHAVKKTLSTGKEVSNYEVDKGNKGINPHGDVEYQLFENNVEPRKTFRADYWKKLQADLALLDAGKIAVIESPVAGTWLGTVEPNDAAGKDKALSQGKGFEYDYSLLCQGHQYLPLVGHAAQAAYGTGEFNPAAFFGFKEKMAGADGAANDELSVIDMIALQNARGVLAAERAIRTAW